MYTEVYKITKIKKNYLLKIVCISVTALEMQFSQQFLSEKIIIIFFFNRQNTNALLVFHSKKKNDLVEEKL